MGIIQSIFNVLFGGGRNVLRDTAQVFRENAEAGAARASDIQGAAMRQYGGEFARPGRGGFDRMMDGVNRLPRPALALGTLGLFVSAMVDPIWFAERMQGIALVPEPMWWLLGVIVSFYFGARQQMKSQNFQREIAASMARAPQMIDNIAALRALRADSPGIADAKGDENLSRNAVTPAANPALADWKIAKGR